MVCRSCNQAARSPEQAGRYNPGYHYCRKKLITKEVCHDVAEKHQNALLTGQLDSKGKILRIFFIARTYDECQVTVMKEVLTGLLGRVCCAGIPREG